MSRRKHRRDPPIRGDAATIVLSIMNVLKWKPQLTQSLVQLGICFLASSAGSGQSIWTEGWQAAQIRTYVVTDTTEDGIVGDRGGWIVYDSAPDCNGAPHPNTAEILSVGDNKILKMTVVGNDCVTDLSVDLFSSPNIPITTNTVMSFTQTGTLSNPQWNGFFPTLFPPPGDSIHLSLLDQNKNAIVYIFQRTPSTRPTRRRCRYSFLTAISATSGIMRYSWIRTTLRGERTSAICFRISVRRRGSTQAAHK